MKVADSLVRHARAVTRNTRAAAAAKCMPFTFGFSLGLLALTSTPASAQAPYLLPYTIQNLAGGGTSVAIPTGSAPPSLSTPCTGTGQTGVQYDQYGDGCNVSSTSVVTGVAADIHDVVVDQEGNVYFLDNGSSNAVIRRIDAHTGIITVYAGTYASTQTPCSVTLDKYGDNCPANDGKANYGSLTTSTSGTVTYTPDGFTGGFAKARGLAVAKNGDVYLAQYSGNVVNKISAANGLFTLVAGVLGGGTATKPTGNIGQKGYTGDGGPANVAEVFAARGVGLDAAGNVYIADSSNNVIRKVTAAGVISTVVGAYPGSNTAAVAGFAGDGGPAASAATLLNTPEAVEVDALGNMFIADMGNARVRVVYAGGTLVANLIQKTYGSAPVVGNIYTIVGNGAGVAATNPGPVLATTVSIGSPRKIRLDAQGNIYIADNGNDVIWFLDATTGYMRVIAGQLGLTSGTVCAAKIDAFGDNCPGTQATLSPNSAMGVAVDSLENVYVTDPGDARLRKVVTNQVFPATAAGSTVTQTLEVHFAVNDGPAANGFVLSGSSDYKVASSNCTSNPDATQDCLVNISLTPTVAGNDAATLTINSTKSGSAPFGLTGVGSAASVAFDPGTTASLATGLKTPQGIAQDAAGNTYIADTGNNRVLEFATAGTPIVIAGTGASGYTGDNASAASATLNAPRAVAVTRSGLIYIADTGNNVVRVVNPVTGTISTVAGGATSVCGQSVDSIGDGCPGTSATLKAPAGLAPDSDGNIYISDSGNNVVRELTVSGYVYLYAGGASAVCSTGDVFGNGCAANGAQFLNPTGLQMDSARNLYIADTGNNEVREVLSSNGSVKVIAGTGQAGASGNGGTAVGAQLSGPTGVAVDAAGGVYIADTGNSAIRLVNAGGTINTTVGTLSANGTGTLPGSAFAVQLASPSAVASNGAGMLVVLDAGNNRAFTDARGSVTYNFGRTNLGATSPTLQIQETSTGSVAATLSSSSTTPLFSPSPALPFSLAGSGSNGCAGNATLAPGSSCLLAASFAPSATQSGNFSATYTESTTNTINSPAPFITLSGTGAVLTPTSSATIVTTPATGSPQYSVPFTVTTTVTPSACNTSAPTCFPTGTVTFYVGGTAVGLPVAVSASGTASQSISGLNVGSYNVTAVYSGDAFYASSSASALVVAIGRGSTTTTVTLSPASAAQFTAFNLSAKVTSSTSNIPTGTFTFYAGTTQIGTASVDARTGSATLLDTFVKAGALTPAYYQNYGLNAGTYSITATYSGDTNYAPSTSAGAALTIQPQAPTFTVSLNTNAAGTAQGSTATVIPTINANNTLSGTISFACTNLPANSTCTFGPPTTLTFAAVPGVPTEQQSAITLWTDVPPGVIPTTSSRSIAPRLGVRSTADVSLAALLGWPVLLTSFAGMLAFRKRLRQNPRALRLFSLFALFGVLAAGSAVLTGCSSSKTSSALTPVGTYTVNFVATGPGGTTVTTPITFTVGAGAPGQF